MGKQTIHKKTVVGRGVKKQVELITTDNGLFAKKKSKVEMTPINSIKEYEAANTEPETMEMCFAEILKDNTHFCNQSLAHKNMIEKIESLPEKSQENLLHELLSTKARISNPTSNLRNVEMNLKTGGRNARVILNPEHKKPVHFSEEKLDTLVANTGFHLNFKYLYLSLKLM